MQTHRSGPRTIAACVAMAIAIGGRGAAQTPSPAPVDDATLLRVFLTDGSSLVSYGEPARVGDRIVFSMPTAATPAPPLPLVNLAASRVDWERTNRYSEAARAAHYFNTQAEFDYSELSGRITAALDQLTQTGDVARR